jgi:N-acetyl-gamma-glutamyl-phosphate reductase
MYARLRKPAGDAELIAAARKFYAGKPFIRVVDHLPTTKDSAHTNYCDITVRNARGQAIIIACLDNLIKGAAGVAVQNFNIMCGFPEATALIV